MLRAGTYAMRRNASTWTARSPVVEHRPSDQEGTAAARSGAASQTNPPELQPNPTCAPTPSPIGPRRISPKSHSHLTTPNVRTKPRPRTANLSPPSRESTPPTGGEGRAAAGAWSSCRGRGWRPRWPSRSPSSPWPPAPPTSSSAAGSPGVSRASAAANNPRVSRELVALPTVQQPLARELPGGCLAPPPCPLIRISGLSIGFS